VRPSRAGRISLRLTPPPPYRGIAPGAFALSDDSSFLQSSGQPLVVLSRRISCTRNPNRDTKPANSMPRGRRGNRGCRRVTALRRKRPFARPGSSHQISTQGRHPQWRSASFSRTTPDRTIKSRNSTDVATQARRTRPGARLGDGLISKTSTASFLGWRQQCREILSKPADSYSWVFEQGDRHGKVISTATFKRPGIKR
jgi:hypothetical protein